MGLVAGMVGEVSMGGRALALVGTEVRKGSLVAPLGGLSIHVIDEGGVQSEVGALQGFSSFLIRFVQSHFILDSCP